MDTTPQLLVFDVNETLSDMSGLASTFEEVGLPGSLTETWFAGALRDGIGVAAAGALAPFADIATDSLARLLATHVPEGDVDTAVDRVMAAFRELPVHDDVPDGITALAGAGCRLVTLSNGSSAIAEVLLTRAGLRHHFERLLTVEDAGLWKPAGRAYEYALAECGVAAGDATLVAVHPWDTDGAARAGLASAWVNRDGGRYPSYLTAPTIEARSLVDLANRLVG